MSGAAVYGTSARSSYDRKRPEPLAEQTAAAAILLAYKAFRIKIGR